MPDLYNLYRCDEGDNARYLLGRSRRVDSSSCVIVVGLNPSTATRDRSDNTITKVEKLSARENWQGFVVVNLYPLRATHTKQLPLAVNEKLFHDNIHAINDLLNKNTKAAIWAAWGEGIQLRQYFIEMCRSILALPGSHHRQWLHFGPLSKCGHPRHPSRLRYTWSFNHFDVVKYQQQLLKNNTIVLP